MTKSALPVRDKSVTQKEFHNNIIPFPTPLTPKQRVKLLRLEWSVEKS